MAILEFTLPLASVIVNVIGVIPILAQLIELGVTVIVAILQLSVLPLLIMAGVTATFPEAFRYKTTLLFTFTIGLMVSKMVTVEVPVFIFPFTSVTVIVTVFEPTLPQLKLVLLNTELAILQLSELPLSIFDNTMLVFPVASK